VSERLTDEELANLHEHYSLVGRRDRRHNAALLASALAELRARRAADLTGEERDALAWAAEEIRSFHWPRATSWRDKAMSALAVFDKLLGGKP
jgi:hypothetical protein